MASLGSRTGGNPGVLQRAKSIRLMALTMFGKARSESSQSSPSLRLLPAAGNGVKTAASTMRNWRGRRSFRFWSGVAADFSRWAIAGRSIARLAGICEMGVPANKHRRPEIAAKLCLVGQPVAVGHFAALRICASARLVTETCHPTSKQRTKMCGANSDRVGTIVSKIEWLVAHGLV